MGDKKGNLELNCGLLLSSFTLNYMLIRVKERGFGIKKIERTRERERKLNEREDRTRGKTQSLGNCLLDHESSVEVGYGFHAFIVNS